MSSLNVSNVCWYWIWMPAGCKDSFVHLLFPPHVYPFRWGEFIPFFYELKSLDNQCFRHFIHLLLFTDTNIDSTTENLHYFLFNIFDFGQCFILVLNHTETQRLVLAGDSGFISCAMIIEFNENRFLKTSFTK